MSSDPPEHSLRGLGIGHGVALGTVRRMPESGIPAPALVRSDRTSYVEFQRASRALEFTARDLRSLGARAGAQAKDILDAQALMAEDPALARDINRKTVEGRTAERAVHEAFDSYIDMLRSVGGYLAERASDLEDVAQRVLAHLLGQQLPQAPVLDEPVVVVARDLSPATTSQLDLSRVIAVVTEEGSATSHTAVLARAKGIVAVVGVPGALRLEDGDTVVVDADSGTVVLHPTAERVAHVGEDRARRESLRAASQGPGRTADGVHIPLYANLGSSSGVAEAHSLGAEGVGLFRTEFLFLDTDVPPSVEVQQAEFVALLEGFAGQTVIVRALDAGADKPLAFLAGERAEGNPALGVRGLRTLRGHEQVLRDQLLALRNAARQTGSDPWVMAPMVATVEEARYFAGLCAQYDLHSAGVMVEVPSAALMADRILAVADFVSIGTNDLTQYTLAADRLLGAVAGYQDPWHPAVLRLVSEVAVAGQRHGKPVRVCGEAAADPLLAVVLVGLGVTSLSMSPSALGDVRDYLARFTLADARGMATAALMAESGPDARAAALLEHR